MFPTRVLYISGGSPMKFLAGLGICAAYLLVFEAGAAILDRPQVYVDRETKQLVKMIMPDEKGNVITVRDYRDPRYLQVLKEGNYDRVLIR